MSIAEWAKRRKAREAVRAGDAWVCPYCKALHPDYEVGGTKFAFGYPSVKFACCGKVAFMLKDAKTQQLLRFTRIGDGVADWMPKEAYFAWVQEQSTARGHRDGSPHEGKITRPERMAKVPGTATAQTQPGATAPAIQAAPPKPVAFVAVAKVSEVPPSSGKVVVVNGRRLALFNEGAAFFAIDDACKHQGRSLGEGVFEDGVVTCNGHGWRYDVRTGRAEHNPELGVGTYPVKVEDGAVYVQA
jgi:nitrite reductase/ring-hydroxylating ferredoxin subunit